MPQNARCDLVGGRFSRGLQTVGSLLTGQSVAQVAPTTIADAEKGLTIANLAQQGLGYTLQDAAVSGILHGSAAAQAKGYYDKAGDFLLTAKAADEAANAQGVFAAVGSAEDFINQAKALVPASKP